MKLVIDISDKMFDTFKKHGNMAFDHIDEYDKDKLAVAIANGTPIKTVTNAEEAKAYPISEDIRKVKKIAEILKKYESEEEKGGKQ